MPTGAARGRAGLCSYAASSKIGSTESRRYGSNQKNIPDPQAFFLVPKQTAKRGNEKTRYTFTKPCTQAFTPPRVKPPTTHFWEKKYIMTGGAAVMTEAAIILPQKKTSSANIVLIPTVAVREYWLVVSTRA